MATLKPQNRKASKDGAADSNTSEYTNGSGYEAHDDYERAYFDGYDPDYYNHDEEDEDYTSWLD